MKKILIGVITAGLLLVGATGVLAATYKSPAEIYAQLIGVSVEAAYDERAAGNSFGKLAEEAGVLEEFQAEMLENKKAVIQERVTNGQLTQEQADIMIQNMEQNIANCDGTGMNGRGAGGKGGFGQGMRGGMGQGMRGMGAGFGGGGCWAANDQTK